MGLASLIDSHRIVVCVGSGGVGKTTTSAAIALRGAMHGQRVLCLTIDPAKRLANSLGLSGMTTEEQLVPPEVFTKQGLECTGSLSAMMLDTKRTFDHLVERYAPDEASKKRILDNKIYQYVSSSLAGTQEYMAMEKLHQVKEDPRWDLIVLDTPPTTNALDFLDAPQKLVGLIDSPAMRWFVQALQSSGKFSFDLVQKGASLVFKGLSKFTGDSFLQQVAEFVTGINALFGGFRERAAEVADDLKSEDVAFLIVTSPNPLAIQEAEFFHKRLVAAKMRAEAIVINGVRPELPPVDASPAELMAQLDSLAPADMDRGHTLDAMQRAYDDERFRARTDRRVVGDLEGRLGATPSVEVPAFEEDVHDLYALSRVADYLTA